MPSSSFSSHGLELPVSIIMSLSPWKNFDALWTSVRGYPAVDFEFVAGKTPLSTLYETIGMIAVYLAVIFAGREFMRNRQPYKLNGLFMAHNFVLTIISGSLLVLFAGQLVPTLWRYGIYENICGGSGWTRPLVVLYYVSRLLLETRPKLTFSS